MPWVVDRIEDGRHAVLVAEGGEQRTVPLENLPAGIREGDALREVHDGATMSYARDAEATERLRKQAEELRASLRRGPSGPVSL